jgi:hypothetical protein
MIDKRLLAVVLLAGFAAAALAQWRTLPQDAKRGRIEHVQSMIVSIDGKQIRLAPGAQVRDTANRLLVPISIPPGSQVKYVLDAEGMLRQAWILTPQEAAEQPAKAPQ